MKRAVALAVTIIMCFSLLSLPVSAADMEFVYYTNDAATEEQGSWAGGSSLVGYNASATIYGHGDITNQYFMWKPVLTYGGKYKVSFWNVIHSTNCEKIFVEVKDKNGITKKEFDHKTGESGFVEIGEFEFEPGNSGYVKFSRLDGGFGRLNCVKYEMLEKGEIGNIDVSVPLDNPQYEGYGVKNLSKKDVQLPETKENATKIYAAPHGSGDGSFENPASLTSAQSKVRELIAGGYPQNGIGVYLMGGTYELSDTFTLTKEDSGTAENPVIWQAYENQPVTFTSGKILDSNLFTQVTDPSILKRIPSQAIGKVYQADLTQVGLNDIKPVDSITEAYILTVGKKVANMSKWPNEGYAYTGYTVDMASRGDSGPRKKGFTYEITEPRALRWNQSAGDSWLMGYFLTDYDLMAMKLAQIDVNNMTMSSKDKTVYGSYNNGRYYILNLLDEIDAEGEWYVDTKTNTLYFYPIQGWEQSEIKFAVSVFDGIKFDTSSNVITKGISIDTLRGSGVVFTGNSSNCSYIGGDITNISATGAVINGRNNTVRDSDISFTGGAGASINGGDPTKLIQSGNRFENNTVHDVGVSSNNKNGMGFGGCGQTIVNNHFYNIPMTGMGGSGLEHTINYNVFERVCLENSDTAAVYFNNEGPGNGTTINYNLVRDPVGLNHHMAAGLYVDNGTSGVELKGNIVINSNWNALLSNCGRENTFQNNIIINCTTPVSIGTQLPGNGATLGGMVDKSLQKNNVTQEPFASKYPRTANAYNDEFFVAKYNVVKNNVTYNCGSYSIPGAKNQGVDTGNISFEKFEGDLINLNDIDYAQIKAKIPEFEEIPVSQMGIYTGGARTDTQDIVFDNRAREFNLSYPANGQNNVEIDTELKWTTENGGIEKYTVYLAEDPNFTKIVGMGLANIASYTANLEYGKTYYWRVVEVPYKGYENRWNTNGVYSFTTVSVEDKHQSELLLVKHLAEITGDSSQQAAIAQAEGDVSEKGIQNLQNAKDAILSKQHPNINNMATQIYDDYTLDTIDQRPFNLFMRSNYKIDVTGQKDPLNSENMVVRLKDDDKTFYQCADRHFNIQNDYVEAGTSVYAEQTNASFTMAIRRTGVYSHGQGSNSGLAAAIIFGADGKIYADGKKELPIMDYEAGKWYDIKIKYRVNEGLYDVYINNEKKSENVPIADKFIKSVYMLSFSTTEGVNFNNPAVGTFYIDNTVSKSPVSTGKDPYLKAITINGQNLNGFEPGKYFYKTDTDILNADVQYDKYDVNANVKITKTSKGICITSVSQNGANACSYYITK